MKQKPGRKKFWPQSVSKKISQLLDRRKNKTKTRIKKQNKS